MKRLLLACLFVLLICSYAYSDTEVVGGAGGISEGDDVTFGTGIFNTTLDEATGDEVAVLINYTTNKASSGNDTGLVINQTDTASPGTSLLLDAQVGGVSKFSVSNVGSVTAPTRAVSGSVSETVGNAGALTITDSATAALIRIKPKEGMIRLNGSSGQVSIQTQTANRTIGIYNAGGYSVADTGVLLGTGGGLITNSTGQFIGTHIVTAYTQTGDASATDLLITRTETSTGLGDQLLIDAQVDDVSVFKVDNAGTIITAVFTRHHDIEVGSALLGPTAPSLETIGIARGLGFDADAETAYFTVEVPDDWVGTSDMTISIDWSPDTAPTDTETVKWDISYRAVGVGEDIDGTAATAITATYTQSGGGTAGELINTSITVDYDDGTNPLAVGDLIFVEFTRDVTGDTFDEIPVVVNWNLAYSANGLAKH